MRRVKGSSLELPDFAAVAGLALLLATISLPSHLHGRRASSAQAPAKSAPAVAAQQTLAASVPQPAFSSVRRQP